MDTIFLSLFIILTAVSNVKRIFDEINHTEIYIPTTPPKIIYRFNGALGFTQILNLNQILHSSLVLKCGDITFRSSTIRL